MPKIRPAVADPISAAASLSKEARAERLKELFRIDAVARGEIAVILGEVDRSEDFRDDGATSTEAWVVQCFGVSVATARSLTHVGGKAWSAPHLVGAMCAGEISFDKVRAVLDVATPETERELCQQAKELGVRELAEVARTTAERARSVSASPSRSEHDGRYVRFSDEHRTMSVQLPKEAYAQTKATVDAYADNVPSDGETPLDQRRCDGFMGIMDSVASGTSTASTTDTAPSAPNPFFVVAHVPLENLVDGSGNKSELAAELQHDGLIDVETVQRIACDATVVVAVDDSLGHTMYEGRAKRFPTGAQRREVIRRDRHCRFPGCSNVTFAAVHHVVPWKPGGGTDLDNLILVCRHHHLVVHRKGWSMKGNANEEITIENPSGRVMMSRPSALWTRVTAGRIRSAAGSSL